jgi:hypothetical protein
MQGSIFTAKNYKIFGICLALLILGYVLLGQGPVDNPLSKSVAPVVLVVVYCILIPYAILARSKEPPKSEDQSEQKRKGV